MSSARLFVWSFALLCFVFVCARVCLCTHVRVHDRGGVKGVSSVSVAGTGDEMVISMFGSAALSDWSRPAAMCAHHGCQFLRVQRVRPRVAGLYLCMYTLNHKPEVSSTCCDRWAGRGRASGQSDIR